MDSLFLDLSPANLLGEREGGKGIELREWITTLILQMLQTLKENKNIMNSFCK